ncbi:MAG: hypothetical protein QOE58_3040 [Actinomycetota bacterium]|nr:hypothetical protein [Actinomycetota bacterium]
MQLPLNSRITFTQPSNWVWNVWLDDKRVGMVSGDTVAGFTARDNDHQAVGHHYPNAEAAMQAWIPRADSQ